MRLSWAISILLFLVALAIRLPHLWTIPSLTDEGDEVLLGLAIAKGRLLPLTNVSTYLGSLYNYLLAAVFVVFGPSPFAARALVVLAGALTVPGTYFLARELGLGQRAALIAAGLIATSGAHVMVSSHVAWAHSLAPLAATLASWLLVRAAWRSGSRSRSIPLPSRCCLARRCTRRFDAPPGCARPGRMPRAWPSCWRTPI